MNRLQQTREFFADEAAKIYAHRFLHNLALSGIAIFLPIFLYQEGFGAVTIASFFIINFGVAGLSIYLVSRFVSNVGYKKSALASTPLIIAAYYLLQNVAAYPELLLILAGLEGLGKSLYWLPMHSEMSKMVEGRNSDQHTGLFFSLPKIGSIASPLVGGVIASLFGFGAMFTASAVLIVVSFAPFLASRGDYYPEKINFKEVYGIKKPAQFLTFFFEGAMQVGGTLLWPLFMTLIITGSVGLGSVGSMMALGGAFFSVFLGSFSNTQNRHRIMKAGGTLFAGSWLTMSLVATPIQAFVVSIANGMLVYTLSLPIYAKILDLSHSRNAMTHFGSREVSLCAGRVVMLGLLALIFAVVSFETALTYSFVIVALTVFPTIYFASRIRP